MPRHEIIALIQRSAVFLAAILGSCARDYFALVMRVLVLFWWPWLSSSLSPERRINSLGGSLALIAWARFSPF